MLIIYSVDPLIFIIFLLTFSEFPLSFQYDLFFFKSQQGGAVYHAVSFLFPNYSSVYLSFFVLNSFLILAHLLFEINFYILQLCLYI